MEGCGDAGRTGEPVEMWGQEMRPERAATWSGEANVRALGIQQQVPAHGPEDHMEVTTSQARAVQGIRGPPATAKELSMSGTRGPAGKMGTFPLTPRITAPRKKKGGNAQQCKLTQK